MTGPTPSQDPQNYRDPDAHEPDSLSDTSSASFNSAKAYRSPEDLASLVQERATALSRAVTRSGWGSWTVRYSYLEGIAQTLTSERVSDAAWNCFLNTLTQIDNPSYGFIRQLSAAVTEIAGQGARSRARLSSAGSEASLPTAKEWKQIQDTLLHVESRLGKLDNKIVRQWPQMAVGLSRLGFSSDQLNGIALLAYQSLHQGRPQFIILKELSLLAEAEGILNEEEHAMAVTTMENRTSASRGERQSLLDIFDIFLIRTERLRRIGVDADPIKTKLGHQRIESNKVTSNLPSDSLLVPIARIMDLATETSILLGVNPVRALEATAVLLGHRNSTKVSLAPLLDEVLPAYAERRWPIEALLANFTPAGDEPGLLKFQNYVFGSALKAGRGIEPFVTKEFLELGSNKAAGPVVDAYMRAFIQHPIPELGSTRDPGTVKAMSGPLIDIATSYLAAGNSVESTARLLQDTLEIFEYYVRKLSPETATNGPGKQLGLSVKRLAELEAPPHVLGQILHLIRSGVDLPANTVCDMLKETECHHALFIKVRGADPAVEAKAREVLSSVYRHDSVPYKVGDNPPATAEPRALQAHRDIQQFMWRMLMPSKAFSLFTFEARKIPGHDHCALIEFGLDSAESAGYLNSSSVEKFPGNGFFIEGIKLNRVLRLDDKASDPYHLYRKAWPFAQHVEDIEGATFLLMRGIMCIIPPNNSRYKLLGPNGSNATTQEHYSTLFFNDHFHNPWSHVAIGVPTRVLERMLNGLHVPAQIYDGYNPDLPDLTRVGLTVEELSKACQQAGVNMLNFGWPSNLGGLCNAYPVASRPFHEWERKHVGSIYKDRTEHIHKAFILDHYSATLTPAVERALVDLRRAHSRVYEYGKDIRNLLDTFLVVKSLWDKGETLSRPESFGTLPASPDDLGGGESESWREDEEKQEPAARKIERESPEDLRAEGMRIGPNSARRLMELYRWHSLAQKGASLDRIPELRIGNTLNMFPEKSPLVIDAATLTLRTGHYEVQLPLDGDGTGEEELRIWQEYVMPYFTPGSDLRFWSRTSAG